MIAISPQPTFTLLARLFLVTSGLLAFGLSGCKKTTKRPCEQLNGTCCIKKGSTVTTANAACSSANTASVVAECGSVMQSNGSAVQLTPSCSNSVCTCVNTNANTTTNCGSSKGGMNQPCCDASGATLCENGSLAVSSTSGLCDQKGSSGDQEYYLKAECDASDACTCAAGNPVSNNTPNGGSPTNGNDGQLGEACLSLTQAKEQNGHRCADSNAICQRGDCCIPDGENASQDSYCCSGERDSSGYCTATDPCGTADEDCCWPTTSDIDPCPDPAGGMLHCSLEDNDIQENERGQCLSCGREGQHCCHDAGSGSRSINANGCDSGLDCYRDDDSGAKTCHESAPSDATLVPDPSGSLVEQPENEDPEDPEEEQVTEATTPPPTTDDDNTPATGTQTDLTACANLDTCDDCVTDSTTACGWCPSNAPSAKCVPIDSTTLPADSACSKADANDPNTFARLAMHCTEHSSRPTETSALSQSQ